MLNSNKIKSIIKSRGITLMELSKSSDISYQGLLKLLANNSTTTDTLEKIADALELPICDFFMKEYHIPGNMAKEPLQPYQRIENNHKIQLLEKEVEHLKRELLMKDEIIKLLKK